MPEKSDPNPERDPEELDQEYGELLSELRVILPGVQLLAGFLLILPFSTGFGSALDSEKAVYFLAFAAAFAASILTIAPSTQHRIRWREGDKEALLVTANRLTIAGSLLLAVSLSASAYLVGQVVYGTSVAGLITAGCAVMMAWYWFLQPLYRRATDRRRRS